MSNKGRVTGGRTTLRDVAAAAGVSPMTASNALHGKPGVRESTRTKVLATAERLGYRINLTASMLKSGRSNIIHIIVNAFDAPFYSKFVQSLTAATAERGLTPFVEQTHYSPAEGQRALASNPFSGQLFDGEIINAAGLDAPGLESTGLGAGASHHGRPIVLIEGCEETPSVDSVNFPNEDGARAAIRHLIDRGCRRIAIAVGCGYLSRADLTHAEDPQQLRLRGAGAALLDAGLPCDETTVFTAYNAATGIEAGHAIADTSDSSDSSQAFDGVFAATDYAAFGVLRGLADRGVRVPDDVKVIGFDGVTAGTYCVPTLSTIQVDFDQLSRFALDMIARRIEERGDSSTSAAPPERVTVGYTLVARESTEM